MPETTTKQIMVGDRLGWPDHLNSREFKILVAGFQKLFDYDSSGRRLEGVAEWIEMDPEHPASDKTENIAMVVTSAADGTSDGVHFFDLDVTVHHESANPDWKVTAKFLVVEERFDVDTRVPA